VLALPRVTLAAIDGTRNPAATERSLADAAAQAEFGRVLLLSPTKPNVRPDLYERAEWIEIPPLSLDGYNRFCLADLHQYVSTSHCLTIQNDSRIVNPDAWDDGWLAYDYIGALWPPGHTGTEHRVGNSGFCLRSARLLRATPALPRDTIVWRGQTKQRCRDDVITCVMYRQRLEAQGLRFAPPDVAARFAFELPTPEAPTLTTQFGTHAVRRRGG
jgi:hypothetical protein